MIFIAEWYEKCNEGGTKIIPNNNNNNNTYNNTYNNNTPSGDVDFFTDYDWSKQFK